jgi:hypothetical protein
MKTLQKVLSSFLALWLFACGNAFSQQGPDAIHKLSFMKGAWHCVLHGGQSNGFKDALSYSFSPDWNWMIEQESGTMSGQPIWSAQIWGYDAQRQKLVAYQFTNRGVFTKSIVGWQKGLFVSRRDDNNFTVSIRPRGKRAFDWIIGSPDGSSTVVQACRK